MVPLARVWSTSSSRFCRLVVILVLASVLAGGCSSETESGFPTSREAASAFVSGVLCDDRELVSRAFGREVTADELAAWREGLFHVDTVFSDAVPELGLSYSDDSGATYVLQAVVADGVLIPAESASLRGLILAVGKEKAWVVLDVVPIPHE